MKWPTGLDYIPSENNGPQKSVAGNSAQSTDRYLAVSASSSRRNAQ